MPEFVIQVILENLLRAETCTVFSGGKEEQCKNDNMLFNSGWLLYKWLYYFLCI